MQIVDGYTTVSTWEKEKRATCVKLDGKWFRAEMDKGRIPVLAVAGSVFVRRTELEAAWTRYEAWRAERAKVRTDSIHSSRASNNERLLKSIAEIDRKLSLVLRAVGVQ